MNSKELYEKALAQAERGEFGNAKEMLNQVVDDFPNTPESEDALIRLVELDKMVKRREADTPNRKNLFLACIAFGLVYRIAFPQVFPQAGLGQDVISIFMQGVMFGILFFGITLVVPIIYYVGYRVQGKMGIPPKLKLIVWVCYWLVVVYSVLSKIIARA